MTAAPRWHRGLRVLLLVPVLGLALVTAPMAGAALGTSASRSTARVAGFDTSRATVRVGGAVWSSITVLPRAARTVTVQYRRAGATRFVTASSGRSSAQGAYDAELMPPSAGVWQFRVVLPATAQARTTVSATRVVVAAGSAAVTRVRGYDSSARSIVLGDSVTDTVRLRPKAPRTVCVQARGPGARDFVTVSVGRADSAGGFRAVYRPATAGVWAYRLLVRAGATARRVVTPARLLTVSVPTSTTPGATPPVTQPPSATPTDSTPPGPVTGLVLASSSSASVHLSWTNPADADFAGVMVRRSPGSTAPASATDGALVVRTTKSATTYLDTGLASSTVYAYALFALDTAGNVSSRAVGTATTGAPTVASPQVNGSTGPTAKETVNNSQVYDINGHPRRPRPDPGARDLGLRRRQPVGTSQRRRRALGAEPGTSRVRDRRDVQRRTGSVSTPRGAIVSTPSMSTCSTEPTATIARRRCRRSREQAHDGHFDVTSYAGRQRRPPTTTSSAPQRRRQPGSGERFAGRGHRRPEHSR